MGAHCALGASSLSFVYTMAIFELRCGSGLPIIWWIPAPEEYHKYQEATLSPVEQTYLETIKETGEAVKQELKKKKTSSPDP